MIRKVITIHKNRKELSSLSGIIYFQNLINTLNLESSLGQLLPHSIRKSAIANKHKFIIGILSLIVGADCIEDIDSLRDDPLFSRLSFPTHG